MSNISNLKKRAIEFLNDKNYQSAYDVFTTLDNIGGCDAKDYAKYSEASYFLGLYDEAEEYLLKGYEVEKRNPGICYGLAYLLSKKGKSEDALIFAEEACQLKPKEGEYLSLKGNILMSLHRYNDALSCYEKGVSINPNSFALHNNLGNVLNSLGRLEESLEVYKKAITLPGSTSLAWSNYLTTAHYHPEISEAKLQEICMEWGRSFDFTETNEFNVLLKKEKKIRIGMISDGFRSHPVGHMIIAALESCSSCQFDFYFYSSNNHCDDVTERFKNIASKWKVIDHLEDSEFCSQVVSDGIDIFVDLSGHNSGNRMMAVAMRAAPLQVKWVGGLINTTGVKAIDYLISDSVETPIGVDDRYVENLIRLPDDYICYSPPAYAPLVSYLPAIKNGFVTFACFNNGKKINDVVIGCWAEILHRVPNSKLYLKSIQYESEEMRNQIEQKIKKLGISADRLIIEGPSRHRELLASYENVDIALDPWPYSGGLTTCEALLMGVPVITLPGPTFAGRHSATHLVNAGMPELVVNSWEEYQERAISLASDLNSLATIRQHLRQVLLESPVCDATRFSRHFTDAMRAIWQRHCEGKQPTALTFDKTGQAQFTDEEAPVDVIYAENFETEADEFSWSLPSKIIALDNGSELIRQQSLVNLRKLKAFGIVSFDPASRVENPNQFEGSDDVQVFPHAVLGNGTTATLYSCLDPALSSTLEPLPVEHQYGVNPAGASVLAKLPINTIALDSIEGLDSLDWLILDDLNDSTAILENGENALRNTLVIQVRIAFQSTHKGQPNLAETQHWMSRHGFRLYRFNNQHHLSHLPDSVPAEIRQATELQSADAVFLPTHKRLAELNESQCIKLAFLLHTVYGIKDMAYSLLTRVNEDKAEEYLVEEGLANKKLVPAMKRKVIYDPNQLECNQREFTLCVGVPVYNEEKYIRETIQSLKNQDFENVRFLIADNCSTDDTLNIICEETADDDRFEIFQQRENIGALENFKFCFEFSKSKYFMWLGAHDYLSEDYLHIAVEKIQKNPNVSMVMGLPMAVDEKSIVKGVVEQAIYHFIDSGKESRYLKSIAEIGNCTILHSLFHRVALKHAEFRKTVSFDHVLLSHLLWHGPNLNIGEVSYYRRYFPTRNESQDERIYGKNISLKREDFYDYYLEDFGKFLKGSSQDKNERMLKIAENILRNRFDNKGR